MICGRRALPFGSARNVTITVRFSEDELNQIKMMAKKHNRYTANFIYNCVMEQMKIISGN